MSKSNQPGQTLLEGAVRTRYAAAAQAREESLCCPVDYPSSYLAVIPEEILERDYGCGDPTRFVKEGETVVDLGSGSGKTCYILSQVVGSRGRVIGVDCNRDMLDLARRHQQLVADRIGYSNVTFHAGMIQDLRLDLDLLCHELSTRPVSDLTGWLSLRDLEGRLRHEHPMIGSNSVDCVVSNCVLNLVQHQDRVQLFTELYRVLKDGGRAVISDIVSDEDIPEELQANPTLWSGCLSGAFRENEFLQAFEEAGFHGIQIERRQNEPWQTVQGIEFRSMTVVAYKGKQGACLERNQAVVYRGPFKTVQDDDEHVFHRGVRSAVCDKTFKLLQRPPYAGLFDAVEPRTPIAIEDALPFDCRRGKARSARETKGIAYDHTSDSPESRCDQDGCC